MRAKKFIGFFSAASVLMLTTYAIAEKNQAVVSSFTFPSTGITVKNQAVLLAIDNYLLPFRRDVCCYMSTPSVRKEPVIIPDPVEATPQKQIATHFYGTVLHDQGKFRMWYSSVSLKSQGDEKQNNSSMNIGPMRYAESDDGLNWTKPTIRKVAINGSLENNALLFPDAQCIGPCVIKDETDNDPNRRYKMVYNTWATIRNSKYLPVMRTATSADGINFESGDEVPVESFMENSSFYKLNNYFFVNSHAYERSEGGTLEGRQGYVRISPDFDTWVQGPAASFMLPEPSQGRGIAGSYDQVHLGVGAASFGNVLVGLYGLWHNRPGPAGSTGWAAGHGGTSCDLGLLISNNGIHFREPVKGYIFISQKDSPVTPVEGKRYPTNLCQSNGILNVGDQTFIYHGRWRNAPQPDYYAEIAVATLPRDRWGAIGLIPPLPNHGETPEGAESGWVWSAPVIFSTERCLISINADNADLVTVEVSDEEFNLLPDFSGNNSGRIIEKNGLDCAVNWPAGSLKKLNNRTIRLRINLRKEGNRTPKLYAVYLKSPG